MRYSPYSLLSPSKSYFCTNPSSTDDKYGDFKELKEDNEDTKQAVVKNLSLRLINTKSTQEVLVGIFENDYLRGERKEIHGEELALILYFAVKHMGVQVDDQRLTTLLDMLFNRFVGLDFDYVLTTIWSMGLLVSFHGAEIPIENKVKLLKELLDKSIPVESLHNLPSLIFSIS